MKNSGFVKKASATWLQHCTLTSGKSPCASLKLTVACALVLCLVLGVALATQEAAAQKRKKQPSYRVPFSHIEFAPLKGRVGYHMVSETSVDYNDLPAGRLCFVNGANDGMTRAWETSGTRPPGLIVPGDDDPSSPGNMTTHIEGTPRQAGDWNLTVTIHHAHCAQGSDQRDYGDRTIEVNIHIDP
jgi:hypothetical protein